MKLYLASTRAVVPSTLEEWGEICDKEKPFSSKWMADVVLCIIVEISFYIT